MPITFAVKKTRNPKFPDTNYYHGQAVKTGELTMDKLAKRINNSTTISQTDCYAVLKSMKENIIDALTEGQVVVLDDLGRFQVSIHGKSYPEDVLTDKEFKPSEMVRGWKIVFRPDPELKRELKKDFKLQRISSEAMK